MQIKGISNPSERGFPSARLLISAASERPANMARSRPLAGRFLVFRTI